MKKWSIFIAVIVVALGYGLGLRDKAPGGHQPPTPAAITAPIYAPASAGSGELVRREAVLMGSPFVFVVDAPRSQALDAITTVTDRLRRLEAEISSWKPGSDVYRLNDNAGRFIKVGADTLALLQLSQQVHVETDGAFDITIGVVWDLYPFRDPSAPLPSDEQIEQALQFIGANRIELDEAQSRARIPAGMKINLGGIGKGYAAKIAIEQMRAMGIRNAAVSAGGDVHLMGKKRSGPWLIRIENPRWEGKTIEQFALEGQSVATSGDAQRYFTRQGKRYSHIISPLTGRLVAGTQSVTVISRDPALADAYATAVSVKGAEEGMQWVNQQDGVEALIIDHRGRVARSSGWQAITGGQP
jgi:thiamine biosynthesis lipoprotein